jgi:hypothetical protein
MNDVWDHPFEGVAGWLDLDTTDGADGSAQSLEFDYDGASLIDHIEVLDLKNAHGLPANWSGIGFLNVWYKGDSGNSAEELDVTLYDSSATEIGYAVLPGNPTQTTDWTLWQIDLASGFTGGNGLSDVACLYIQVSKKGAGVDGTGTMNIDQVELVVSSPPAVVSIDIYPNRTPNQVFLSRNYTLYVAVLGSATFSVADLNPATVKFGRTGTEASPVRAPLGRDLNGDGYLDAMYGFRTLDCGFELGDTEGILTGRLFDGTDVRGVDSVLVSP